MKRQIQDSSNLGTVALSGHIVKVQYVWLIWLSNAHHFSFGLESVELTRRFYRAPFIVAQGGRAHGGWGDGRGRARGRSASLLTHVKHVSRP